MQARLEKYPVPVATSPTDQMPDLSAALDCPSIATFIDTALNRRSVMNESKGARPIFVTRHGASVVVHQRDEYGMMQRFVIRIEREGRAAVAVDP